MALNYKVKKATSEMLGDFARGRKRINYPFLKMKVGEYFEAAKKERMSIYNAIKHRRNYTKEIEGWVFTIKCISKEKVVVIRLK